MYKEKVKFSTTTECGVNYQLLAAITEVAQWGTPSCSWPQPAMNNGIWDGRSNWLGTTPECLMHSMNRCSSATAGIRSCNLQHARQPPCLCSNNVHARMFSTLTDTTSIPAMHVLTSKNVLSISIPMPWVQCIYMQEHSVHSLIWLLYLWVWYIIHHTHRNDVFTWKNILHTLRYHFYTHGCNVFTCKRILCTCWYHFYTWGYDVLTCKNVLYTHSYYFCTRGCDVFISKDVLYHCYTHAMGVMYLHARTFCILTHVTSILVGVM